MSLRSGARALARAPLFILPALALPTALAAQLPSSALSVRAGGREVVWWRSQSAPTAWHAPDPVVAGAVRWTAVRPGLERGRLDLSGEHVGWRVAVILARLDPARFTLRLDTAAIDGDPDWSIDRLPAGAALAVNAGQFTGDRAWGWLVMDGRELQPPGFGPLSSALVIDAAGHVSIADAAEIPALRAGVRAGEGVRAAFQSYPAVLAGEGEVPEQLRGAGRGIDLQHRDSRLGLCTLRDGRLLLALTRFVGLGDVLNRLPFGPTTPEMAAILGALGCRRAVLLDGGLSGQLVLRPPRGPLVRYPGLRAVPLALVAWPNPDP